MLATKLFKKFLMPCGLCAAVPAIKPADSAKDCPVTCDNKTESKLIVRPSELPIYSIEDDCSKQMAWKESGYLSSTLEEAFGQVRRSLQGFAKEYHDLTDSVTSKIETGMEHSQLMLDRLRDETNKLPRVGAIGMGGLTGFILALRGGKFKRLVYTSTGLLITAAVCYPKQAAESLEMAQHYVNIGYNFAYGVKPGDERLTIALPKLPKLTLPTSLSEFFELTIDTGSAVIGAVTSVARKAQETVSQTKEEKPTSKSS